MGEPVFTGLIQDVGEVLRVAPGPMTELWIRTSLGAAGFALGESIAVDGACLTVVERTDDRFRVQAGHVDSVARILSKAPEGGSIVVHFELPAELAPFFIDKGSVTVDGISLTVNRVERDRFSVALIPETQERTTLARKGPGDEVNLEADLIGKYVARLHGFRGGAQATLSEEAIQAAGFGTRTP
jgi:riboflavin synthase